MWKLFATVLAVSDTGSISTTGFVTDFNDPRACALAVHDLFSQPGQANINGHIITIKVRGECRPDGSVVGGPGLPPPLAGAITGFLNGFAR